MTVYESLSLMIAFASLIVFIISYDFKSGRRADGTTRQTISFIIITFKFCIVKNIKNRELQLPVFSFDVSE